MTASRSAIVKLLSFQLRMNTYPNPSIVQCPSSGRAYAKSHVLVNRDHTKGSQFTTAPVANAKSTRPSGLTNQAWRSRNGATISFRIGINAASDPAVTARGRNTARNESQLIRLYSK